VTNDFPPRFGGVQQYVWNLVSNLPSDRVGVLAPSWPGAADHDAALSFEVHRWPSTSLVPTPALRRRVAELVRAHGAEVVVFGHGFPLPLLGPALSRHAVPYVVLTHGAEVWQACVPGFAEPMRRALQRARVVTAISRYTANAIRGSLGLTRPMTPLAPGVDERRFHPSVDGGFVRDRHGLGERSIVVSVSRLVPRKGHDVLIQAMADLRSLVPDAALLIAGDGPHRPELERLAATYPSGTVILAGAVADADLPAYYAAGDVFAMPCRSRYAGLEVEGFGIVYLEAAATAKPAIAGRSGGASEAVVDGETGTVVESREPKAAMLAMVSLLDDPPRSARYGAAGRARVEAAFTWKRRTERLAQILAEAAG
jgi:phosphatidylinositol alpha-1,6-mannosyltransferase